MLRRAFRRANRGRERGKQEGAFGSFGSFLNRWPKEERECWFGHSVRRNSRGRETSVGEEESERRGISVIFRV